MDNFKKLGVATIENKDGRVGQFLNSVCKLCESTFISYGGEYQIKKVFF